MSPTPTANVAVQEMVGARLVGADARLARRTVLAVTAFAAAMAIAWSDPWWTIAAITWFAIWIAERRVHVQVAGDVVVVQNRGRRHEVRRDDIVRCETCPRWSGAIPVLHRRDGTDVPISAFRLLEPSSSDVEAVVATLRHELEVRPLRTDRPGVSAR